MKENTTATSNRTNLWATGGISQLFLPNSVVEYGRNICYCRFTLSSRINSNIEVMTCYESVPHVPHDYFPHSTNHIFEKLSLAFGTCSTHLKTFLQSSYNLSDVYFAIAVKIRSYTRFPDRIERESIKWLLITSFWQVWNIVETCIKNQKVVTDYLVLFSDFLGEEIQFLAKHGDNARNLTFAIRVTFAGVRL